MQNIKMEDKKMGEMYTEKEWMTQMVYYLLHRVQRLRGLKRCKIANHKYLPRHGALS